MNNWHWRGTNLGGWLVLEPWITPSLFYQFLGAAAKFGADTPSKVAFDSYSFCIALGKEEANRQLRRHWKTWVTEEQIYNLAQTGIDTLRVPIGDWMLIPYEPYVGCFDGALDELNRVLDICKQYNMKVFLDIHAMKGAQNTFDNSGHATIIWTTFSNFQHVNTAGWLGDYDVVNQQTNVNRSSIQYSLEVIKLIVDLYKDNPVIVGLEAINEPW
jgi:glucan 1,3-beta-glucosidase